MAFQHDLSDWSRINDNVMEMLIMINACKGGSARSITGASIAA